VFTDYAVSRQTGGALTWSVPGAGGRYRPGLVLTAPPTDLREGRPPWVPTQEADTDRHHAGGLEWYGLEAELVPMNFGMWLELTNSGADGLSMLDVIHSWRRWRTA